MPKIDLEAATNVKIIETSRTTIRSWFDSGDPLEVVLGEDETSSALDELQAIADDEGEAYLIIRIAKVGPHDDE